MKNKLKSKLFIVLLILSLLFLIFLFPSLIGYYFDPFTGIYFKYTEDFKIANNLRVEKDNQNRIVIVVKYRPKGMVNDFPAVTISRRSISKPYELFGFSSLGSHIDPKSVKTNEIKINGKPARNYRYGNSGLILMTNPQISVEYKTSYLLEHSFVEKILENTGIAY